MDGDMQHGGLGALDGTTHGMARIGDGIIGGDGTTVRHGVAGIRLIPIPARIGPETRVGGQRADMWHIHVEVPDVDGFLLPVMVRGAGMPEEKMR